MDRERWKRIEPILDGALDLPRGERTAYLDEACAGDNELRAEVEKLLEQESRAGDWLDTKEHAADWPGDRHPGGDPASEVPLPESIGPYRVLSRLGEGGMGVVYLAEQEQPVRRRVAVKVIKVGMDTDEVIARFDLERQALGMMSHPNIARVLDAGTNEQGRPFFVMEYVPGMALTDYCDRHQLDNRRRLELFRQVCRAVHHAHQRGIIHRDIKPSNVLVTDEDGTALPKVIDFGVAKATEQHRAEKTLFTRFGQLVGTPEYMSPEQAAPGDEPVDTRTDVYSLGALLYELLVGVRPFGHEATRTAALGEILRIIREKEPSRPSARLSTLGDESRQVALRRRTDPRSLARQLRGDLDWIVMRTLEKERERRYASAAELASEIDRYLNDEAVLAGPPRAAYRARKFVRRHRFAVGAAVATVAVLAAFAATMTWQAARTARERDRADREARTARRALEFLTDVFAASDPAGTRGETITAREILDAGAERVETELADEPEVQASLLSTIGNVRVALGLLDSSLPALERSLRLRRELHGDEDPATLKAMHDLASARILTGDLDAGEPLARRALATRRGVLGNDHEDTLQSIGLLASIERRRGNLEKAEALYREALEGFELALGPDHESTILATNNMAFILGTRGKMAEAETYHERALAGYRRTLGDDHPHTLTAINNMGYVQQQQGKLAEAERLFLEALAGQRQVLGDEHHMTLRTLNNLGHLLGRMGRLEEAERYHREALTGRRASLGDDHPDTLQSLNNMGALLWEQGRPDEAEAYYRESLDRRLRLFGTDHPGTIASLNNMGNFLEYQRDLVAAEDHLRQALEAARRVFGNEHRATIGAAADLGDVLVKLGRLAQAESLFEETVEVARASLDPSDPKLAVAIHGYGRCLSSLERYDDAEPLLIDAHARFSTVLPEGHARTRSVAADLASLYEATGRPQEAERWRRK